MRLLAVFGAALLLAPAAAALTVTAAPTRISFGDALVVTAVGKGSVELHLGAWTALTAPTTRTRGGTTTVTQRVACVADPCVPSAGDRVVPLPTASSAGRRARATIVVSPRVAPAAVAAENASYRRDISLPSTPSHEPAIAALAFVSAALVLLAARALAPARRREAMPDSVSRDAVARALRLLRESAGRPPADRRRAADLVGRLAPATAEQARGLAWARPDPRAEDVEGLAARLEEGR